MTSPPRTLKRFVLRVAAAFLLAACGNDVEPDTSFADALTTVSGGEIREHMRVLADDAMQGREAGTPGHEAAAAYVAARMRAMGLQPLGDDGTFLQSIRFFETRLAADSADVVLHKDGVDTALTFGDDFIRSGGFGNQRETVAAALAFVGFGIEAPEYEHDDYAGIDVAGKILVQLTGAPPRFATDQRAYYSSGNGKSTLAVRKGALGIISIRTPVDQQRLPWSRYLTSIGSPDLRWLDADRTPHNGFPELVGNTSLSESGARRLFDVAGFDLDELFERHSAGHTGSFDLGVLATVTRSSDQRHTSSPNVIGRLPGSDSKLRHEFILYTAHLDHLGIRPGGDGDDNYNGAYDNAAGVAAILEIAEALAAEPVAPRRSIIFAAVTAEEKGLQGSDYLAHNPPVPIGAIVANINIDMPYLGFPIADVHGFGAEHSTLQIALKAASNRIGLALTPDPRPELVRFIRSDQFSFVQQGVPGLNFKSGSMSSDPSVDGDAMLAEFLGNHYHRTSDDLALPFHAESAERFVRTALLLGLFTASADERPRWNDGDFFGTLFGHSQAAENTVPGPPERR